jgi:predicted dehydrogenase
MSGGGDLRVALAGCGRIGASTRAELAQTMRPSWLPLNHADAIDATPGMTLAAVCDPDRDRAREVAGRFGEVPVFTDARRMLAECAPDVLSIATRTDVRPGLIDAACAAGVRAIHTEKPIGQSLGEVAATARRLEAAGVLLSYGALRRYMPIYAAAREAVRSGAYGELQAVTVRMGRGGLLWVHPHSADLLQFFTGAAEPEWLQATMQVPEDTARDRLVDSDPVVLAAAAGFADGVIGQIVPAAGLSVELHCSQGSVRVPRDGAWLETRSHRYGRAADPQADVAFAPDMETVSGRIRAFAELRDALAGGPAPAVTPSALVGQHRILFGWLQSHLAGGQRIAPEAVDPELRCTGRTKGMVS